MCHPARTFIPNISLNIINKKGNWNTQRTTTFYRHKTISSALLSYRFNLKYRFCNLDQDEDNNNTHSSPPRPLDYSLS